MKYVIGFIFLLSLNVSFSQEVAACDTNEWLDKVELQLDGVSDEHLQQMFDFIASDESAQLIVSRFSEEEIQLYHLLKHKKRSVKCKAGHVISSSKQLGNIGVSGFVREQGTNAIITSGYVHVYGSTGNFLGLTVIDAQGNYSYTGLGDGTYYIRTDNTGYFDELWNDIPCAQGACDETNGTPITINGSSQTANFNLIQGGSISGTVREQGTDAVISNGYVHIYNSAGQFLGLTTIDSQGNYVYSGLGDGTYYVRTDNTGYLDELWDDMPCPDGNCEETDGTPIVITGNDFTANFILSNGGSISGTVTEDGTTTAITDGYVHVYNSSGSFLGLTVIDSQGNYNYSGLGNGTYYVRTDSTGYFDELWDNMPCAEGDCQETDGTAIVISDSDFTANFELTGGGAVSGFVREQGSNAAITNGYVHVYDSSGDFVGLTTINDQGNYIYTGLDNGTYFVRTDNTGYFDELWNNMPCAQGACNEANGTQINVNGSNETANFNLIPGNSISGSVREHGTNAAITNGYVHIYNSNGQFLGLTTINNQGNYVYSGLDNGTYYIRTDNTGYIDELWDNILCSQGICNETSGTPIVLNEADFVANFILGSGLDDEIFTNGFE